MINAFDSYIAAVQFEKAALELMFYNSSKFQEPTKDETLNPMFPGEFAAIVTNHSFALELLLKSLILVNHPDLAKGDIKLGHELDKLFKKVPEKVQTLVEVEFNNEYKNDPHLWIEKNQIRVPFPDAIEIHYNRHEDLNAFSRSAEVKPIMSQEPIRPCLSAVLKRNSKSFVDFRYSWENWEKLKRKKLVFDFLNIHILINVIKRGLLKYTGIGRYKPTFTINDEIRTYKIPR